MNKFDIDHPEVDGGEVEELEEQVERLIELRREELQRLDQETGFIAKIQHIQKWLGRYPLGRGDSTRTFNVRLTDHGFLLTMYFVCTISTVGLCFAALSSPLTVFGYEGFFYACLIPWVIITAGVVVYIIVKSIDSKSYPPMIVRGASILKVDIIESQKIRKVLEVGVRLAKSCRYSDALFVEGPWVLDILRLYPKSLAKEREALYKKRMDALKTRIKDATSKAETWGIKDELAMTETELRATLEVNLDELTKQSELIMKEDLEQVKSLEVIATETIKRLEQLGLVTVIDNVCAYCSTYIKEDLDECPSCGAPRRTTTINVNREVFNEP
jgi:hypothetical protein